MAVFRALLVTAGLGLGLFGLLSLIQHLSFRQLIGLMVWLGAAVIAHDAVLAPIANASSLVLGKFGDLPPTTRQMIAGLLACGGLITVLTGPAVYAQRRGPANPTVLPADYTGRLLIMWGVINAIILVAAAILILRARLRRPHQG